MLDSLYIINCMHLDIFTTNLDPSVVMDSVSITVFTSSTSTCVPKHQQEGVFQFCQSPWRHLQLHSLSPDRSPTRTNQGDRSPPRGPSPSPKKTPSPSPSNLNDKGGDDDALRGSMSLGFHRPTPMIDWKAVVEEFIRAVSRSACEALLTAFSAPTIESIYA